jgi:Protein of unknown function (DUF1425)
MNMMKNAMKNAVLALGCLLMASGVAERVQAAEISTEKAKNVIVLKQVTAQEAIIKAVDKDIYDRFLPKFNKQVETFLGRTDLFTVLEREKLADAEKEIELGMVKGDGSVKAGKLQTANLMGLVSFSTYAFSVTTSRDDIGRGVIHARPSIGVQFKIISTESSAQVLPPTIFTYTKILDQREHETSDADVVLDSWLDAVAAEIAAIICMDVASEIRPATVLAPADDGRVTIDVGSGMGYAKGMIVEFRTVTKVERNGKTNLIKKPLHVEAEIIEVERDQSTAMLLGNAPNNAKVNEDCIAMVVKLENGMPKMAGQQAPPPPPPPVPQVVQAGLVKPEDLPKFVEYTTARLKEKVQLKSAMLQIGNGFLKATVALSAREPMAVNAKYRWFDPNGQEMPDTNATWQKIFIDGNGLAKPVEKLSPEKGAASFKIVLEEVK